MIRNKIFKVAPRIHNECVLLINQIVNQCLNVNMKILKESCMMKLELYLFIFEYIGMQIYRETNVWTRCFITQNKNQTIDN